MMNASTSPPMMLPHINGITAAGVSTRARQAQVNPADATSSPSRMAVLFTDPLQRHGRRGGQVIMTGMYEL